MYDDLTISALFWNIQAHHLIVNFSENCVQCVQSDKMANCTSLEKDIDVTPDIWIRHAILFGTIWNNTCNSQIYKHVCDHAYANCIMQIASRTFRRDCFLLMRHYYYDRCSNTKHTVQNNDDNHKLTRFTQQLNMEFYSVPVCHRDRYETVDALFSFDVCMVYTFAQCRTKIAPINWNRIEPLSSYRSLSWSTSKLLALDKLQR